MNISTFARRVGISPSGVRWYESAGILPSPLRRDNGYREYSDADVSRLTLILALRRLGLTPAEAGRLVHRCLEGEATDPALTDTLEQQRRQIARQREDLDRLELELVDLERTLAVVDPGRGPPAHVPDRRALRLQRQLRTQPDRRSAARPLRRGGFDAVSAGTRPREVQELAVRVLAEVGIDWRTARAKPVTEFLDRRFDYVVTLSNSAREECPTLAGPHSSLHWHLDDPNAVVGSEEQRLEAFRATRTELTVRLRPFIEIARRAAGRLPPSPVPSRRAWPASRPPDPLSQRGVLPCNCHTPSR